MAEKPPRRDQGRRGRPSGKPEGPWKLKLGYKRLQELKDQSPHMILLTIGAKHSRLHDALNDESVTGDMIVLFLRCIARGLECRSLPENAIQVVTVAEASKWKEKLLLLLLQLSTNQYSKEKTRQILTDAMVLFKAIAEKIPSKLTSIVGMHAMLDCAVNKLRFNTTVLNEEVWALFQDCIDIKEQIMKKSEKKTAIRNKPEQEEEKPEDDFREIPVHPVADDFKMDPIKPTYIRRNKKKGKFSDVNDYLDIQFRLLREDFICPLRDGIHEYKEIMASEGIVKKFQDLRIYNNVYIISPKCTKSGLSYRVSFDTEKLQRVKWEVSKRLIYGSLVALSSDNFKTFLFASVADRDPKTLREGIVDLQFETDGSDVDVSTLDTDLCFTMAETTAYFEAYKHVLLGLKRFQENNLPFERYIVECETTIQPPQYLRRYVEPKFDLRPLIDQNIILKGEKRDTSLQASALREEPTYKFSFESERAKEVCITKAIDWPSAEKLHLDSSQYTAVKNALTREFVITQGPPGTGKTYIGLQIAKALLHNYKIWNGNNVDGRIDHRPILVVCYTNHALDQFLEGIVDFYKGDVVRVGGRSTSEKLAEKGLSALRRKLRSNKEVPKEIFRARMEAYEEMMELSKNINRLSARIENVEREIVHEDVLQSFMGQFYLDLVSGLQNFITQSREELGTRKIKNASAIVEWLGYGELINVVHGDRNMDAANREGNIPREENNANEEEEEVVEVEDEVDQMMALRNLDAVFDDILNLDDDEQALQGLQDALRDLELGEKKTVALNVTEIDTNVDGMDGWQMTKEQKKKMKKTLRKEIRSRDRMSEREIGKIYDVWNLTLKDKWRLYRSWTRRYSDSLREKIIGTTRSIMQASARHQNILLQEDREIIRRCTVIGMTTTGAAKYQSILHEIGPRIIIVEEAAEVLEGHIITSLSHDCQHLILIGDHKQLKPNPTVYKLAKDFNLDLSLFERMINNGMQFDCLELQHRMRPQISRMMKIIYPELRDHEIVMDYPNVKGVSSNMFFITHEYPENHNEDLRSHSNPFEAGYIVALCEYFLLQGYERSQITILTLYSGQLFEIRRLMPKHKFGGVRVTVVDNFQGEENDIILMSLVRSNDDGKIGFLKIENRVCVALSRAKHGLYVVGNMGVMEQNSKLWRNVAHYARTENIIDTGLLLQCQNHPNDEGIFAETASDFNKAPNGGCMKPCEFRLQCGHTCPMVCHIQDRNHEDVQCTKICRRKVCNVDTHYCKKRCFEDCGDCQILVEKIVPRCGHKQMIPCHMEPNTFSCKERCEEWLSCGHECINRCGERCTTTCRRNVFKTWECGHRGWVACYKRDSALCTEKCEAILKCGHPCSGTCGECYRGKLHVSCRNQCGRPLVCEHTCPDYCSLCPPCRKPCENRCIHSKCSNSCGELCIPCKEICDWRCHHFRCTRRCSEPCNRPRCNEPCEKILGCGHRCIGLCGETCPPYCRECNADVVREIFFGNEDEPDAKFVYLEDCRHIIEYEAMDHWMDKERENRNSSISIQLRTCPKCKTPIRRNLRYGNIVKNALLDVEKVKKLQSGDARKIQGLKSTLRIEVRHRMQLCEKEDRERIRDIIDRALEEGMVTENELVAIDTRIKFFEKISKIEQRSFSSKNEEWKQTTCDLDVLRKWLCQDRKSFSEQEIEDAQDELQRINKIRMFLVYKERIKAVNIQMTTTVHYAVRTLQRLLIGGHRVNKDDMANASEQLEHLKKKIPLSGLGVSEEERVQIVKAMGLGHGHYYKCPKGHIYAIGDCGGATVESKCPECGSTIGGTGHRLRADNALASEMDGARHAAWSEHANDMHNFDLRDLNN